LCCALWGSLAGGAAFFHPEAVRNGGVDAVHLYHGTGIPFIAPAEGGRIGVLGPGGRIPPGVEDPLGAVVGEAAHLQAAFCQVYPCKESHHFVGRQHVFRADDLLSTLGTAEKKSGQKATKENPTHNLTKMIDTTEPCGS